MSKVFQTKQLKQIIESRFKRWKVREDADRLIVEATAYKIRKPSREYEIGWRWEVSIVDGAPVTHSLLGWNTPKYASKIGTQNWEISNPPEQLKTKVWNTAWPKALESLHKKCEFDVKLPNGLIARWDPWTDKMMGWGEVPKVMRRERLNRVEMAWDVFLEEQLARHGNSKKIEWQKALLLLREPHPSSISRYETKESREYKELRRERIKQARAAVEAKNGTTSS